MSVGWTDARVLRLKELWAAGSTCAEIAADLGGFANSPDRGRNAVIGKIHRLKLPQPKGKNARSSRTHARPAGSAPVVSAKSQQPRRNPTHNIEAKIATEAPGPPERFKGEAPDGTGIQLRDLNENNCHWPKGDPLEANFEFCGASAIPGMPYCRHHCRMSYAPPRARVQADRWALHRADIKS